jgi:prepilin-type N-terminal cleavage/methylation domain-containing protein
MIGGEGGEMEYRRGFTLIEVIIATAIIGILASVAVVTQKSLMDRGKGAEARNILLSGYVGYQRLIADNEPIDASNLLTWPRMGMSHPNAMAGRYFTYTIQPSGANPQRLQATRGVAVAGCVGNATQRYRIDLSTGKLTEVVI